MSRPPHADSSADIAPLVATMPEFRRLRAFVVVAEELNFRRAASRLMMTQSPLSRLIKSLENDVGVALFERNRHTVRLTPAGKALFEEIAALFTATETAVRRAREAARYGGP